MSSASERCTWCGSAVEQSDGFRLAEPAGERGAVFCRLEHIVPWTIRGAHWEAGVPGLPAGLLRSEAVGACAECGAELTDDRLVLVRHRGQHRIPDGFCSVDHLLAWAKAGGRWGSAP